MSNISAQAVKELREVTGVGMMECKKALTESNGDLEAAKELLRKKGQAKALKKSSRDTPEGGIGFYLSSDKRRGGLIKVACETDFVARNEKFKDFIQGLAEQVAVSGDQDLLSQKSIQGSGSVEELIAQSVGSLGENMRVMECRQLSVESGTIGGYIHSNGKIGVMVGLTTSSSSGAVEAIAKDIAMHIAATPAEAISESEIPQEVLDKEREIFAAQARESGKPENIIEKMIEGRIKKFVKEVCVLSQPFVKNPEQSINDLLVGLSKELGTDVTLSHFAKFQF